ncbi:Hypothetical protein ORPV_117, partial [Orpheovirus IHUMI-LCC2]
LIYDIYYKLCKMDYLFIQCGTIKKRYDIKVRERIDSIFPQLSELVKDNILELQCFKLQDEEIMECMDFLLSIIPIEDLDIRYINKNNYILLQNYIYYYYKETPGKFCLNLIILFEYFVAQISINTIICLMSIVGRDNLQIMDEVVIKYINDHVKSVKYMKKFLPAIFKILAYNGIQSSMCDPIYIDKNWLCKNFKPTDKLGGYYIPKKKNYHITYIYKDNHQALMHHRCDVKAIDDNIFGITCKIDDVKYWEYKREECELILMGCDVDYIISYKDLNCISFDIMYGLINIMYEGKALGMENIKSMTCIINGNVLYNKLFNTTIDDICEIILDIID